MENNSTIHQLVIDAMLIATTAVITRLSANSGKLGLSTKWLKSSATKKLIAYIALDCCLVILIFESLALYRFVTYPAPPTRLDVFLIVFQTIATIIWFYASTAILGLIAALHQKLPHTPKP